MITFGRSRSLRLAPLALVAVLLTSLPDLAWSDQGLWLVAETTSGATVQFDGTGLQPLVPGTAIAPGSQVRTGPDGRVVLKRARNTMTLAPNSHTVIPLDSDRGARTTILQRLGTLLLQIDKRPEHHFEVKTPYLAAVVKGTTFTVDVNQGGAAVHVVEGAVEVGTLSGGPPSLVRPGQTARVSSQPGAGVSVTGKAGQSSRRGPAQDGEDGENKAEKQEAKADKSKSRAEPAAPGAGKNEPAGRGVAGIARGAEPNGAAGSRVSFDAPSGIGKALGLGKAAGKGKAKGKRLVIVQTLGFEPIDIAAATGGLVVAAPPRPGALASAGASDAGGGNGRGAAVVSTAAPAGGNGKGLGKSRPTKANLLGGVPGRFGAVAGLPASAASPAAIVSRNVSAAANPDNGKGNAYGLNRGNNGVGLALGHDKGNGNGNGNGKGNGKAKGKSK